MQGSLINRLMDGSTNTTNRYEGIEVGMGATETMWSDRHAGTIVEVRRGKTGEIREVVWQRDKAIRVGPNTMSDSQSYEYERDENAQRITWRADRTGKFRRLTRKAPWSETDMTMVMTPKSHGGSLVLGVRNEHYDYSF